MKFTSITYSHVKQRYIFRITANMFAKRYLYANVIYYFSNSYLIVYTKKEQEV